MLRGGSITSISNIAFRNIQTNGPISAEYNVVIAITVKLFSVNPDLLYIIASAIVAARFYFPP